MGCQSQQLRDLLSGQATNLGFINLKDRQGARPDDSTVHHDPRRRGDPVTLGRWKAGMPGGRRQRSKMIWWGGAVILLLTLWIFVVPPAAAAEKPASVYRIGYVGGGAPGSARDKAFVQELGALGWIDGQNIAIDYRWAEGDFTRIDELAEDLVRRKTDMLVIRSVSSHAGFFAQRAPRTIPMVALDPREWSLASLARPGGNLTGISLMSVDLDAKRPQLLKETLPRVSRVDVLLRRGAPGVFGEMLAAAKTLGVVLRFVDVTDASELDTAFSTVARDRAGAIIVTSNDLFLLHRR
jgi:putative ABC transport system substrate-binding protein